jgi:hypothetical protein
MAHVWTSRPYIYFTIVLHHHTPLLVGLDEANGRFSAHISKSSIVQATALSPNLTGLGNLLSRIKR